MEALLRLIERISGWTGAITAWLVMPLVLATVYDVFARYVFNAPLIWTYELVGMYLMPALFYFAVSDTLAEDHHIAVDLLARWFPTALRRVIEALASAVMAALFAWLVWIFGQSALANFQSGAVVMGAREWPTWIPDAVVVIGSASIALRLFGRAIGHVLSLLTGKPLIGLPRSTMEG